MFGLNPWMILGAVFLIISLCAGSAYEGKVYGENAQQVTDQKEFNRINAERALQKAEAQERLNTAYKGNIALMEDRNRIQHQLEVDHVQNQDATNALRHKFTAERLRYRSTESSGNRDGCGQAVPAPGNATGAAETTIRELPDAVTRELRQIAYDADQLSNDYALCYSWALGGR